MLHNMCDIISLIFLGRILVPAVTRGCAVDEVQLHGEAAGHHDEHATDPRRLVGGSV